MFSWIKKIGEEQPDHPLFDTEEARKYLVDLPTDNPLRALDEITSWLISVKDTADFRPASRTGVIMLLDETGQPFQEKLLQQFTAAPHLLDPHGPPSWQGLHNFMQALGNAYALCLHEHQQEENNSLLPKEQIPLLCVRLMRAAAELVKLELMRYQNVRPAVWEQLFVHYSFAEANHFAGTLLQAYPLHPLLTSTQRELLRALILHISSPNTLAQQQIETCSRIAARLGGIFDLKEAHDPDCIHGFDLSRPGAPEYVNEELRITGSMRFCGAVNALPKLEEIIHQHERSLIEHGHKLHDEFTPDGKLTVLKHLQIYWRNQKRFRQHERHRTNATIEVAHSFKIISRLVKCVDLSKNTSLSEEDAAMLQKKAEAALLKEGIYFAPEIWPTLNMSSSGIGCLIPKTAGDWVKIGSLCGIKPQDSPLWWVGMVQRIKAESHDELQMGIRIFAHRPLSVWLRFLGKNAEQIPNWESISGSFVYSYLPVILLPDAQGLFVHATMLMESGNFAAGSIYEMMLGGKSCNVRIISLLEEGEDYEQVSFEWLATVHS